VISEVYRRLEEIALEKFGDVILETKIIHSPAGRARKLRISLFDGSYIDVWYSKAREYSYHWERRMLDGKLFRHDNAPHKKWESVKSFPKHFHEGKNGKVTESRISSNPAKAIEQFMSFVRKTLNK